MTQKATLIQEGSNHQSSAAELAEAVRFHRTRESVSFHTPGHKGVPFSSRLKEGSLIWDFDVTELPGLDELASPAGVLRSLEKKMALLWQAEHSFISVNGASAALMAAILSITCRGSKLLLPRNAHRSAVQALVLSGLEPLWYEPSWDANWGLWSEVETRQLEAQISEHKSSLAGVVIVSPTYAGAISDLGKIAQLCRKHSVALIVDEAHGSHSISDSGMSPSAVSTQADIVVHSLHKTLPGLTQTGAVHLPYGSAVKPETLRSALNLLHTSSPNYVLLGSVDEAITFLSSDDGLASVRRIEKLQQVLVRACSALERLEIYTPKESDPAHILVRMSGLSGQNFYDELCGRGVFPETVLGDGVLFMLGTGSTGEDVEHLICQLKEIHAQFGPGEKQRERLSISKPPLLEQVLSPREAFLSETHLKHAEEAIDHIAADCIAPCPPGLPLVIPGQRLTGQIISQCESSLYRVVRSGEQSPHLKGGSGNPPQKGET